MCRITGIEEKEKPLLLVDNGTELLLVNDIWTDTKHQVFDDILGQVSKDVKASPLSIVMFTLRNLGISKDKFDLEEVSIIEQWYKESLSC